MHGDICGVKDLFEWAMGKRRDAGCCQVMFILSIKGVFHFRTFKLYPLGVMRRGNHNKVDAAWVGAFHDILMFVVSFS